MGAILKPSLVREGGPRKRWMSSSEKSLGTRVLAYGEDTHAYRLRASSTRSARSMRTHPFACAQELSASELVPPPKEKKKRPSDDGRLSFVKRLRKRYFCVLH